MLHRFGYVLLMNTTLPAIATSTGTHRIEIEKADFA